MKPTQQRTEEGEDFPNYVWVGFDKDDGTPQKVYPTMAHGKAIGDLDWQMYFPADFRSSRVTALELELERAKETLRAVWASGVCAGELKDLVRAALRDLGEG